MGIFSDYQEVKELLADDGTVSERTVNNTAAEVYPVSGEDITSTPDADSQTIVAAVQGKITHTAKSITGAGHLVGTLGWSILNASGETASLIIGSEGKLEVLAGTATTAVAAENQITTNDGTITTAVLTDNQVVDNNGTIATLIGTRLIEIGDNTGGTITALYGAYFPDLSSEAGTITAKYMGYGLDPNAPFLNYGGFQNSLLQYIGAHHPGIASNRYYSEPHTTVAAVALTADLLYHSTVIVPERVTITRIGCEVTTEAASTSIRLGIYKMSGGIPTELVLDAGTIDSSTAGEKEITISQTLDAGVYSFACVSDGTPTINWRVPSDSTNWQLGSTNADDTGASHQQLITGSHTFGALPATFPSVTYNSNQAVPHLWFRKV